jgi:hypothetical protein
MQPISDPPPPRGQNFSDFRLLLLFRSSLYKCAKFQRSTSSRSGLDLKKCKRRFHFPFRTPRGKISRISDFFLWFGPSLYKSAKFRLSASFINWLAFLHNDTKEDSLPNFGPPGAKFSRFWIYFLVWVVSLYICDKFQLSVPLGVRWVNELSWVIRDLNSLT